MAVCKGGTAAQPLANDHAPNNDGAGHVALSAVRELDNINALAAGQELRFGVRGLTIIYGDNGAGKSGYARVLKAVCRARVARGDVIRSNVYESAAGLPTATIDFVVGGQQQHLDWQHGATSDPLLAKVSVFDSRCATLYVENKDNQLAFTPGPLRLLADVAKACDLLKGALEKEIAALISNAPPLSPNMGVLRIAWSAS